MAFQFPPFLRSRGIPFSDAGHGITKGHIGLRCPFCGPADRGEHLGVNIETNAWSCWRDPSHASNRPHKLIMQLLGCTYTQAAEIVGDAHVEVSEFSSAVQRLRGTAPRPGRVRTLEWPRSFRPVAHDSRAGHLRQYLRQRGFPQADEVAEAYGLRWCPAGSWANRLIFPVELADRGLVNWTGRSVGRARLRYVSLGDDDGALCNVKDAVWNHPQLATDRGDLLLVAEGPFDALKLDWYGQPYGARATALFGTGVRQSQLDLLRVVAQRYRRVVIVLDPSATAVAMRMARDLADLHPRTLLDLGGAEDPGALTAAGVKKVIQQALHAG